MWPPVLRTRVRRPLDTSLMRRVDIQIERRILPVPDDDRTVDSQALAEKDLGGLHHHGRRRTVGVPQRPPRLRLAHRICRILAGTLQLPGSPDRRPVELLPRILGRVGHRLEAALGDRLGIQPVVTDGLPRQDNQLDRPTGQVRPHPLFPRMRLPDRPLGLLLDPRRGALPRHIAVLFSPDLYGHRRIPDPHPLGIVRRRLDQGQPGHPPSSGIDQPRFPRRLQRRRRRNRQLRAAGRPHLRQRGQHLAHHRRAGHRRAAIADAARVVGHVCLPVVDPGSQCKGPGSPTGAAPGVAAHQSR